MERPVEDGELTQEALVAIGCDAELSKRVVALLSHREQLAWYLSKCHQAGCIPITRIGQMYPHRLRRVLNLDAPGVLFAKGDTSLLENPTISVVGSRELKEPNLAFANEVGKQAALQGYTLVSGNARGADRAAQESCLRHGGKVICVVADSLKKQCAKDNVLYLSEDGFNLEFSSQRALLRNRIIHSFSNKTFVVQCALEKGGTWSGSCNNLRNNWSKVICFDDGSLASRGLACRGALLIQPESLWDFSSIESTPRSFLE